MSTEEFSFAAGEVIVFADMRHLTENVSQIPAGNQSP